MEDKKIKKQKSSIMISALGLIVSIFVLVNASFAWFTIINPAVSDDIVIETVSSGITQVQAESLAVSDITETNMIREYKTVEVPQPYSLPPYDPENLEYSEFKKALIIRVSFMSSRISKMILTAKAAEGYTTSLTQNYLSNCILFYDVTGASNSESLSSVTVDTTTPRMFADMSKITGESTFDLKQNEIILGEFQAQIGENVFYIVMEYNVESIDFIYESTVSVPDDYVNYAKDVSFLLSRG